MSITQILRGPGGVLFYVILLLIFGFAGQVQAIVPSPQSIDIKVETTPIEQRIKTMIEKLDEHERQNSEFYKKFKIELQYMEEEIQKGKADSQ